MRSVRLSASGKCFLLFNRRPAVGNNRLLLCAAVQSTIGSSHISVLSCQNNIADIGSHRGCIEPCIPSHVTFNKASR